MMKKLMKKAVAIILMLATLMCFASCDSEEEDKYRHCAVGRFNFSLPADMLKAYYVDGISYKNADDTVRFVLLTSLDSTIISTLPDGASTEDYATRYVSSNKIEGAEIKMDSKGVTMLTYTDTEKNKYHRDVILYESEMFYHIMFFCNSELFGQYDPQFLSWIDTFSFGNGPASEMVNYSESSLCFSLPAYMAETDVNYADVCYGNISDNAQFFVYFYAKEQLVTELYLDKEATVKEYADWFVAVNEYENVDEKYDEENKEIVLKYVYEPEGTFYCDYITRNEYALFHVTMTCDEVLREKYESLFDEWIEKIYLLY